MPVKPFAIGQNDANVGMSRLGGARSQASTPLASDPGSAWTKMESTLLSGSNAPTSAMAKKLAGQNKNPGRQFNKLSDGGETVKGPTSPKAFSARTRTRTGIPAGPKVGANAFSAMEKPASSPAGKARLFPTGGGSIRKLKG